VTIDPLSIDTAALGLGRLAMANPPGPTTGTNDGATSQVDPQTIGKDTFLKLLVAQLKYQNPMEPVDSSQFMAQTAQFTMVEKLQAMAAQTDALVAGEAAQRAAGLLGRQVTYVDGAGAARTGVVTGTRFGADGPVLLLGQTGISLDDVREVAPAPAT
jgi:flagellar basal-body rod modification protein FlgD